MIIFSREKMAEIKGNVQDNFNEMLYGEKSSQLEECQLANSRINYKNYYRACVLNLNSCRNCLVSSGFFVPRDSFLKKMSPIEIFLC